MLHLATDKGEANMANKTGGRVAGSTACPETFEIAATDPHYTIATPDWTAESFGCGFALNEKGNKNYAIVAACGSEAVETPLKEALTALYNDTFNGILMQNYRTKYAEFALVTTDATMADGSAAQCFSGTQTADDYGAALNCHIYGYAFRHDGMPFIVAYIVMDESADDDAKQTEVKGYVDEMINTVRAAL